MSEYLDIYDDNLVHIGSKSRAEVHRDGDWHKVFHCWVIYRDEQGEDWVILQKRSADKDTFPNYLDISAAGHYEAGETIREAMRELHEELGLYPSYEELIPLGKRVSTTKYQDMIDRQVSDVYFYICNQALDDYDYQSEEISGLIAINVQDGLHLFTGDVESINVPAVGFDQDKIDIKREDFIPSHDHYMEKIFVLATRCLNNESYLWV